MTRNPEHIFDELLVLRCQSGDRQALEMLVSKWNARLLRHAYQLTDNREAARDVAQETWLAVVRGIGRLNDPASFPSWVYRIAGNKSKDWIRRQQRKRKALRDVAESTEISAAPDPSEQEKQDDVAQLQAALEQLPSDQKAILSMLYLDGMSVAAIAKAMSIPPGTVKSRLHHARDRLKRVIERSTP